jgi:hypothetical protein
MTHKIFAASYQRGVELMAAGCPLDYLDALADRSAPKRKLIRAEQLAGYAESRVYLLGPLQTGYLIGLRLGTDRPSGTVITDWSVEPPWPGHAIFWDYEARDFIPERDLGSYRDLLDSRLMGVLNDRRLLRRGNPVDGLLCGYSYQPVPEFGDRMVSAKLILVDDIGNHVALGINLAVVRPAGTSSKAFPTRAGRPGGTI